MYLRVAALAVLVALAASSPVHPIGAIKAHPARPLPNAILPGLLTKDPGNANNYIDLVLALLNPLMPDRVDLPNYDGVISMTECYMFGLDNGLARDGDATMVTVGLTVKFTSAFALENIGLKCHWRYFLMGGEVTGTTEIVSISSGLSLHLESGSSPVLTEFRVTEMADIKTDITGLTIFFNWLAEDIANIIISNYMPEMILAIESVVGGLLQQVLDAIVIP